MKVTKPFSLNVSEFCYNFKLNIKWCIKNPIVKLLYLKDGISLVRSPEFILKKSHPALNKKLDSKTY